MLVMQLNMRERYVTLRRVMSRCVVAPRYVATKLVYKCNNLQRIHAADKSIFKRRGRSHVVIRAGGLQSTHETFRGSLENAKKAVAQSPDCSDNSLV